MKYNEFCGQEIITLRLCPKINLKNSYENGGTSTVANRFSAKSFYMGTNTQMVSFYMVCTIFLSIVNRRRYEKSVIREIVCINLIDLRKEQCFNDGIECGIITPAYIKRYNLSFFLS